MFKRIIGRVIGIFKNPFAPSSQISVTDKKRQYFRFREILEFPDRVNEHIVYIVGEPDNKWVAVFKCPCGCNDTIQLNLLEDSKPSWRIVLHKKKKRSISPSINRIVNCKSHFNITKGGRVRWWGD